MGSVRMLDAGFHRDLPTEGGGFGEKWKKFLADTLTEYFWDRHNRVDTTNHYWMKYDRVDTTNYYWEKYNRKSTIIYKYTSTTKEYLDSYYRADTYTVYKSFDPSTWNLSGSTSLKGSELAGYYMSIDDKTVYYLSGISTTVTVTTTLRAYRGKVYTQTGSSTKYVQGSTSYGEVSSTTRNAYPDNNYRGSYWYVYSRSDVTYSCGTASLGEVTSTDRAAYPDNSYSGTVWYVYARSDITYSKGSTDYGEIKSTNRNAYPDNSYSGTTWYTYDRAETSDIPGDLVGEVIDYRPNVYPENGVHTDDYYYIKEVG